MASSYAVHERVPVSICQVLALQVLSNFVPDCRACLHLLCGTTRDSALGKFRIDSILVGLAQLYAFLSLILACT